MYTNDFSLYTAKGQRKYLNSNERKRFLEATRAQRQDKKLFCQLLYYTGARIGEVHNLTGQSIDLSNKTVVYETLKKRTKGVFREIPIPAFLLDELQQFTEQNAENDADSCLWGFSLRTASRHVKEVMNAAGIIGQQSSAKGLRHGFAVHAVSVAPVTLVKKWLGHARLETTEIYLGVIGVEEREIAAKLWEGEC